MHIVGVPYSPCGCVVGVVSVHAVTLLVSPAGLLEQFYYFLIDLTLKLLTVALLFGVLLTHPSCAHALKEQ